MKTKNENLTSAHADAATVAKFVGLTSKRVQQLHAENRIPAPDAAGLYPLAATVQRYIEFLRARADTGTITTAKRRKLEAQASIAEMELAKKRGELLDAKAVETVWTARKLAVRDVVLRSPLPKSSQDEILNELADAKATDYLKPGAGTKA
jgi:phage terminase Nu1 subunit (DNA packaging protein)